MQRSLPLLYSFRRCPYAIRARLALSVSHQQCVLREIILRNKPAQMLALSSKATVPVLLLTDGHVLDESLDIMIWALDRHDPQQWLVPENGSLVHMKALIATCDGAFKDHLDRYKYAARYGKGTDPVHHRTEGVAFLTMLNDRLGNHAHLFGKRPALADFAIFPFVRQFANTDRDWFDNLPITHLQNWLAGHLKSDLFQGVMYKWPLWTVGDEETLFPV
ncbi:MAG: glutathione S-transferase [Rhodospirillaceae bacterium]|nr:glutathione S-transferase [Rhodospirillaceae bacterium]MBL6932585.1 glutathione S-transferase [Rhodospirillales bacterium]